MAGDEATREGSGRTLPSGAAAARLAIAIARGDGAGKLAEGAVGESVTVGSAADNDLVCGDRTVSRYHLELTPSPHGIQVKDLGSRNGTFAGGIRLLEAIVARGTQLRIGDTVIVIDAADSAAPGDDHDADLELPGMVFASEAMKGVARRVHALAAHQGSLLVVGETGTGKELVARAVHEIGARKDAPFVVVDCASLPPTLLEAELFGHEKGAFTGADRARAGAFERANGGTVFLDEVGELPLAAQGALLGVLERRRFRRVGGDREIAVDVRVVSATNRDLRREVNDGGFRADLYFRLAGARVVVPPLRDRRDDVDPIVRRFATELTGDPGAIPDETIAALAAHPWPGNVRELRSAVERAIAFGPADLAAMFDDPAEDAPARDAIGAPVAPDAPLPRYRDAKAFAIATFEREYLAQLLSESGGVVAEAARRARMDRAYLVGLLRRYKLR